MEKTALLISGIIFFIVSILHLTRYLLKLEVKVGNFIAPLWLSLAGFVLPFSFSLWIFSLIR
jgi:hypothetical protein